MDMGIGEVKSFKLFDHYDAVEEKQGVFLYLDVAAMPMGLFGNLLLRIIRLYYVYDYKYIDHFELNKNGSDFRVVLLFKKE